MFDKKRTFVHIQVLFMFVNFLSRSFVVDRGFFCMKCEIDKHIKRFREVITFVKDYSFLSSKCINIDEFL